MQIKQVDYKMNTKKLFFRQHLVIFLGNCTYKNESQEKVDSEASAQTWAQGVFSLKGEGEEDIFNFWKLLWGRYWFQLNETMST